MGGLSIPDFGGSWVNGTRKPYPGEGGRPKTRSLGGHAVLPRNPGTRERREKDGKESLLVNTL